MEGVRAEAGARVEAEGAGAQAEAEKRANWKNALKLIGDAVLDFNRYVYVSDFEFESPEWNRVAGRLEFARLEVERAREALPENERQ